MKKGKWKKGIVAVIMGCSIICCDIGSMGVSVSAEEEYKSYYVDKEYEVHVSGDYKYIIVDKEAVIVGYSGSAAAVSVPSSVDGFPVTVVGYYKSGRWSDEQGAFENNKGMQSVVVPSSVQKIEKEAFRNCSGLQQVSIGSGVKEIADSAFRDCTYMQGIKFIGDSLETIGNYAFTNDKALDGVVLPNDVKTIGNAAFQGCEALSTIKIPDSVTVLGGAAFANCTSLADAVIGDGITSLLSGDVEGCLYIGSEGYINGTFEGCKSLGKVTIGSGVEEIGIDAFSNTGLKEIVIPDNVLKVEKGAFCNCDSLKTVTIGNKVKSIGEWCFYDNNVLETVSIGKRVNTIGKACFLKCISLKEIVIPSCVQELGQAAFAGCSSMKKAIIGNGVTSLPGGDVGDCLYIGSDGYVNGAFEGCTSLEEVTIGNGVKEIGTDAFSNTALKEVTIPDNVLTIGNGAFYNCDILKNVKIGNGVTTIGKRAFWHCDGLSDVEIGKGVTTIEQEAFCACVSLKELNFPSNITSLGKAVCAADVGLEKVMIGNGITALQGVGDYLTTGSDYYINGAFEGCTALKEVSLGSGLTSIGVDSFADTKISTLFIPKKVSAIDNGAFYGTGLSTLYFAGVAPEFGEKLFGTTNVPYMYKIAGKTGFEETEYVYKDYTPITVTFDTKNDMSTIVVEQLMSADGGYVIEPIPPAAENYIFLGWYADSAYTKKWDFVNDKVTGDTTLYAKWVKTDEALPENAMISDVYEATATTTQISWNSVSGAEKYNIYKDGVLVGETQDTVCQYTIANLEPDTSYEITVTAVNKVGESKQSLVKVVQTTQASPEPEVPGDVNGDEKVDLSDAQIILKSALKLITLDESVMKSADVNGDEKVNLSDAQLVLKYALKLISSFK